jgi:4-amino-4-deoxy-L-arabinose transferase-like glycosyltransferase
MQKTLIETSTKKFVNVVALPDDWSGAEGEWQIPEEHEFVDGVGSTGFVWDGTKFFDPNEPSPLSEEESIAQINSMVAQGKILELESAVTPRRLRDSILTADGKTWLDDQEKLIAAERSEL